MSTLRINNIEAQSIPASPTIDEKVKVTNSSGDILVNIDGKTSGITTIGINTTDGNIKFDANSNVLITGILTATTLAGNFTPDSLEIGSNLKLGNAGVITATAATFTSGNVKLASDSQRLQLGSGQDLWMYHTGTSGSGHGLIQNDYGTMYMLSTDWEYRHIGTNNTTFKINGNQSVQLFYNNSSKLATTNAGVTVSGLSVQTDADISGDFSIADKIVHTGDTNTAIRFPSTDTITTETAGIERLRIDSSGHLHTGYTSSFGNDHINILASDGGGIAIAQNNSGNATSGTVLGSLSIQGYLSGAAHGSAEVKISGIAAANHTGSSAATDMVFYTKPSSTGPGSAPTERLRINSNGIVTKPYTPMFIAGRTGGNQTFTVGTFPFNVTRVNVGNHYNTSTYKFTAPVAGVYYFHAQIYYNNGSGNYRVGFRKETSGGSALMLNTAGHAMVGNDNTQTLSIIESLAVGDTVRLFSDQNASIQCYYNINDNTYGAHTYFMGYLIG